jgi:two-component system response regulator
MNKDISTADILLIEDNLNDADLTLRALKKRNLHVNTVHFDDGAEALEAISRQLDDQEGTGCKQFPHLILLDLKLPGLGGKEILSVLKRNEATRMVPVVMLTSSNQLCDVKECYQLGANAYIVKPVDFTEYINAVAEAASFWLSINYLPDQFN